MGKDVVGWGWREDLASGFLSITHLLSFLSPEIRMSKPLEAEKQSLDSPSEHTGERARERRAARACERRGRLAACPFSLSPDTERNGPDVNHQVRPAGAEGREGAAAAGAGVQTWHAFPMASPALSSQNPQNKASPFSLSPTGPSTKVGTMGSLSGEVGLGRKGIISISEDPSCTGNSDKITSAPSHPRVAAPGL